ncbi:uncharacterized protein DEA37_0014336 [Paragonimus westermani]|uniref:Uncharacterized protein n=1 Tax=Paragonimus westermani TaxID=34504 RepID=A0A5J4NU24_9TREM|nr:uncharacterized protein DEA37_0014336 [Paragonimus westermani]
MHSGRKMNPSKSRLRNRSIWSFLSSNIRSAISCLCQQLNKWSRLLSINGSHSVRPFPLAFCYHNVWHTSEFQTKDGTLIITRFSGNQWCNCKQSKRLIIRYVRLHLRISCLVGLDNVPFSVRDVAFSSNDVIGLPDQFSLFDCTVLSAAFNHSNRNRWWLY